MAAAQLLWINLLMDTFAAFALATEPPLPSVIKGRPHGGELMSGAVWRQIIGISCLNLAIMGFVILFGELYLDLEHNEVYPCEGEGCDPKVLSELARFEKHK